MPKRIIDGERTWRSKKLRQVKPESYRPEYLWMFPLANDVATFECDPQTIWATCYAAGRPSVTLEDVEKMLEEFERVKLLYRWQVGDQTWGYWVGSDKPGLLPPPSQRYNVGPQPKKEDLEAFLGLPYGETRKGLALPLSGFGFGSGSGSGLGTSGRQEDDSKTKTEPEKAFQIED